MDRLSLTGYEVRPGFIVAQELGLLKDEGLEVTWERATFAPEHNKGMAEGRWNMTLSSADTMLARMTRDGTDYVIFMNLERGLDVKLVGAPAIRTLQDIRGTTMAGDPGDSNYDLHRRKIMRDHDVTEDQYDVKIVGATPERYEALIAGEVTAAMLTHPLYDQAVERGCHVLADAAQHVPAYPVCSGWTLRSWAEEHRNLVVRFIRACARGNDWVLDPANREAMQRLVSRDAFARAASGTERIIPHAAIDPPGLARVAALRAEMGVYDPPFDPVERFYDASYWTEATGLTGPSPYGVPDMAALATARPDCGCLVAAAA